MYRDKMQDWEMFVHHDQVQDLELVHYNLFYVVCKCLLL